MKVSIELDSNTTAEEIESLIAVLESLKTDMSGETKREEAKTERKTRPAKREETKREEAKTERKTRPAKKEETKKETPASYTLSDLEDLLRGTPRKFRGEIREKLNSFEVAKLPELHEDDYNEFGGFLKSLA